MKSELIDTHTHLFLDEFDNDRNTVVECAIENGVTRMLIPNIDSKSIQPMLALCAQYPQNCFPMIGLHPTSVDENYIRDLDTIFAHIRNKTFYGIGETGIDLYWSKEHVVRQAEAFGKHIEMAHSTGLPLIIHARNSFNEIFEVLDKKLTNDVKGIFHCFSGNVEQAEKAISFGFKLGIGGVVTYKNSGLEKVLQAVDISHIVLETDSPFLAPVPQRGKRNESSYLIHIAQKVADIYGIQYEEVACITTQNARELFKF